MFWIMNGLFCFSFLYPFVQANFGSRTIAAHLYFSVKSSLVSNSAAKWCGQVSYDMV